MNVSAGILLKTIRDKVFHKTLREFAEIMYVHHTTLCNYEKNNFGKNILKLIDEISDNIVGLITNDSIKTKLKYTIEDLFKDSIYGGSQDYNFLISRSIDPPPKN